MAISTWTDVTRTGAPAGSRTDCDEGARPYALIMGNGRSGSNRLLDILDCHERTFCRNEPEASRGGVFRALPASLFEEDLEEGFIEAWRRAVRIAAASCGKRDRFDFLRKTHFRSLVHAYAGQSILGSATARRALASIWPRLRAEEWPAPSLYFSRRRLGQALPVLKLLQTIGWALRTHEADQGQIVLHIMRTPGGFLRSWWNRYVPRAQGGPEALYRTNRATAERIAARFGVKPGLSTESSKEALLETELWRWRHVNETLLLALGRSERYLPVFNERVDADPEGEARRVYAFAGLDFAPRHARRIAGLRNRLFGPRPHTRSVEDDLVAALAEKVLAGSPLPRHFEQNGVRIL